MKLSINGQEFKFYNQVSINLIYDSIASTFSAKLYFDPNDIEHRNVFKPLTYKTVTIHHGGVLVLTGTILNHHFASAGDPPKQLVVIEGYSQTGILGDCTALNTMTIQDPETFKITTLPTQFDNMSITHIAEQLCRVWNLGLVIDEEVKDECAVPFTHKGMKEDETIAHFLDEIIKQKNIVLSHTNDGKLLITQAKSDKLLTTSATYIRQIGIPGIDDLRKGVGNFQPSTTINKTIATDRAILYDFAGSSDPALNKTQNKNGTWTGMNFDVCGQGIHSFIQIVGEKLGGNRSDHFKESPLVKDANPDKFRAGFRPKRVIQTSGDDNDTAKTARYIMGVELENITLRIDIKGWTLGGHLVTPNQLITVINPDLWLYKQTKFFIKEVSLYGDEKTETATLICVLPECFNDGEITNIFE